MSRFSVHNYIKLTEFTSFDPHVFRVCVFLLKKANYYGIAIK